MKDTIQALFRLVCSAGLCAAAAWSCGASGAGELPPSSAQTERLAASLRVLPTVYIAEGVDDATT